MAGKPVVFHPEARNDAESALVWYQARSLHSAGSFLAELESAIKEISRSPRLWPVYDVACRGYPLRRYPYFAIYRETEGAIEILAVAHGRRRPGYWRRRVASSPDLHP